MTDEAAAWTRLGERLMARRVDLGYPRRAAFARDLGLSHDRTLADLELARRRNFERSTLMFIEKAYGWQPGSIDEVLAGRDPIISTEDRQRHMQRHLDDIHAVEGQEVVTPSNPAPGETDRPSVRGIPDDSRYVADRGRNDPPGRISDEELLAVIRRQRQELDELERRIRGDRPVEGA